ncbi:hypothetical protein QBC40DRAFT_15037 [Triangularia verruculosa]|uniref:AHC1-like C2H2 zinc-finger domain-containing protein n=1 Tax=Triangularia verruculosa TaxID=2587418 RepID=A0AAN6X9G7_9PEZI|nr:hypothetical protein QBC40DRAFT_15037 [Triangularia verruculosa]
MQALVQESPMFRFWSNDPRGSDKTVNGGPPPSTCPVSAVNAPGASEPLTPVSPKRRRPSFVDTASCSSAKRIKTEEHHGGLPSPTSACADNEDTNMLRGSSKSSDVERAKDAIQYQFGLEILLKHDELRLIDQELAKCQVALEQLRRCHLIPYPVQCPTPSQMLEISSGKGPALQPKAGQPVPKWAPPFGVVDGPYARHYAKWLIPDPMFDGIQPEAPGLTETGRARNVTAEGRATRNSMSDASSFGKQRPARGNAGQRLNALSSGYPPVKDKHSPCTVKRSDGLTVKLVCIDCHRWDFSSTQGFINHCRIAHRRDFKSHEEAAVHCGHPIEVDDSGAVVGEETKTPAPVPAVSSGLIHPLARNESISEQQAYRNILSRINASLELYHAGKLPNVKSIPRARKPSKSNAAGSPAGFVSSSEAPYLSRLMQKKKLSGNLKDEVTEAKVKVDWDMLSPGEDSDIDPPSGSDRAATPNKVPTPGARTPAVMRMPARSAVSPSQPPAVPRPASSKSHAQVSATGADAETDADMPNTPSYDDEMDVELSPNTMASNNAPSLVSDDGEYDDSDDGSVSDSSDAMEIESVSDVAEINLEEDVDVRDNAPRSIQHCRKINNTDKMKKDENRHVTFVTPSPVPKASNKGRRKQQKM